MVRRISQETHDYASALLAEVITHAESDGSEAFLAESFTDLVLGGLEEDGLWPDYQLAYVSQRGVELSAWGQDTSTDTLYLAVTDFKRTTEARSLTPNDRRSSLRRVLRFAELAVDGKIEVPDHSPARDAINVIRSRSGFSRVQCDLLSNRVASSEFVNDFIVGNEFVTLRVWDLEAIRRARTTGVALEPIEIDFAADFGGGLPALRSKATGDIETFVLFISGESLARIYSMYGPRLLEQNVRSFLMARGKVNQGLRDTLRSEPSRFLAYNNGITATASEVQTERSRAGDLLVTKVKNLQIVNGAQTTASVAIASRDSAVDIGSVTIQMKLVRVGPSSVADLVPLISRYANAQNAVSMADLSASHVYLRRLQEVSRREWTPLAASARPTKWYFERARGSYNVERSEVGTPALQRAFEAEFPPEQKFDKNQLALYENTWAQLPHIVSRGGQKNFLSYLERLDGESDLEERADQQARADFKNIVSRAIIFRSFDRLVGRDLGGTYKRQVVTYSLAGAIRESDEFMDLDAVWRAQAVDDVVLDRLVRVARTVKQLIVDTSDGRNVTEWTKSPDCWTAITARWPAQTKAQRGVIGRRDASRTSSERRPVASPPRTLEDAIESALGEPIRGSLSRYRRKKWRYVGDTGIAVGRGTDTWHIFAAEFSNSRGPYLFQVAVDFHNRTIVPVEDIKPASARRSVLTWLEHANG